MVYFRNFDRNPTTKPFSTGLLESEGRGMVFAPDSVHWNSIYIRTPNGKPWYKAGISIVICTLDRPESLNDTIHSLINQTLRDFEIIVISEKGDLSALRDKGLRCSDATLVSLIDDDVYCPPTWLRSVVEAFTKKGVVGVTGPTTVSKEFKKNRDCFKYERLRRFQERLFKVPTDPSKLSPCGAPSMASNDEGCDYDGPVDYLECCNFTVRRKEALDVGGFDHQYIRTSEWCELDLALKLRQKGQLWFKRECALFHRPSQAGVFKARLKTHHRWTNFVRFQRRWVKPSLRRHLYWGFIWTYLKAKELRMI